jgi:hypothetical protein
VNSTDEAGKWLAKRVQEIIPAGCMQQQNWFREGTNQGGGKPNNKTMLLITAA